MAEDRLIIQGIVAEARIGVYDWEQAKPQTMWCDLELAIDAKRAAAHDDVKDAVDYGRLVTAVKELVRATPYRLLETVAEAIAGMVVKEFHVPDVMVRVKKRALPGVDYAAVEVVRRAG